MILNIKIKRVFFILLFISAIIVSAIFIGRVFSYDSDIAHPFLTEKAVKLFTQNSEIEISQQQLEWIKQGAIEEDTPIRWMNHFYNPINSLGLFGFSSAKDWSRESVHQLLYPKGNQAWQKAIDSYVKGNKKEAFIALGHVLHLIEDMSVPAHTRDDAHPEGDPYEIWAKDNIKKDFGVISITKFNNLNDFFDVLANYSNKYFLSKDTIDTNLLKNLKTKTISFNDKIIDCILYYEENNKEFCIISSDKNFINPQKRIYYFTSINHLDYYSLLAPKAISYGAGMIDLFFKEVEKEEQKQQKKSWFDKLIGSIAGVFGESGQIIIPVIVDVGNLVSDIPAPAPMPTPSSTFYPEPAKGPTSIVYPELVEGPTPTPTPAPTLRVGLLPYPGFGGGAPPAPLTSDVFSSTSDVAAPTPEPSPEPSPSPSPFPTPTPTPTPTPIPTPQPLDVVINEVAWAGTSQQTSQDEWIELYNRTSQDINLEGWILHSDENKPWIELSGTIPAQGYYLIERTDDNTVADIPADRTVSFDNGLNNNGELLFLKYASTTIDQTVLCFGGGTKWPVCYDYKYRTMERINPDIAGADATNWSINNSLIRNGIGSKGGIILGTPKARNSANYLIDNGSQSISKNITLKKSLSPYIVHNQIQTFSSDAVLTIEPGVVIKFNNDAGLNFSGNAKIISQGTADDPIVFTSFSDDDYGGDINNDATSTMPTAGSWFGINIETSNNDSVFDYNIFRYAGKYYNGQNQSRANLAITGVSADIQNSIFENSKIYGLKLANSDSNISDNIFRDNNSVNDTAGLNAGLIIGGGSPTVQNNQFINNARGLYLSDVQADIKTNDFQSNRNEAVYSSGPLSSFSGNFGFGNAYDNIILNGDLTQTGSNTFVYSNDLPYFLWGGKEPKVVASSTLEIGPGVVFKFSNINHKGQLEICGNLIVSGIDPDSVIFTSIYDGFDDGDAVNGQWNGIFMKPGSYSEIHGATFKFADIALIYQNSPIYLSGVKFIKNNLAVYADADSIVQTIESVDFIDNVATTTPSGLW